MSSTISGLSGRAPGLRSAASGKRLSWQALAFSAAATAAFAMVACIVLGVAG
jgi:hypothetical protein